MPSISSMTVVVAYDIEDNEKRKAVASYILDTLGGERRTESVFEFVYSPPITPPYANIMRELRKNLRPDEGDQMYVWDVDKGTFRRLAVHTLTYS